MARRRRAAWWVYLLGGLVALSILSYLSKVTYGGIWVVLVLAIIGRWWYRRKKVQEAERRRQWEAHQQEEAWRQYRWQQAEYERQQREYRLAIAQSLGGLLTITPTEFEHVVADVLTSSGYSDVRLTGKVGDRGVDIMCRDSNGLVVAVQCKQYTSGNKVSGPDVRNLLGSIHLARASRGILVTTSSFTKEAMFAADNSPIELIDGERFVNMATAARRTDASSW